MPQGQPSSSQHSESLINELPLTSLEEKQQTLSHLVKMVCDGLSNGLFAAGQGGLGKSRTIQATLDACGAEVVLVNSHITPLALYKTLFQQRMNKIIWLDDCDSIYGNLQVLGILRSGLWGTGSRIVTYTSTQLDDIPNRFEFQSRIIFCANSLPTRSEAFKAVLSRVDCFELTATREEIIELMRTLADRGYRTLSPDLCHEVIDFIEAKGGDRQLSMRVYEPSLRKRIYAEENGIDWTDLVSSQLDQIGKNKVSAAQLHKATDCDIMMQVLRELESTKDQELAWCKATRRSRASFFRLKKKVQAETDSALSNRGGE